VVSPRIVHAVQVFQMEGANIIPCVRTFHSSASEAIRTAQNCSTTFPAVIAWSRVGAGPPVMLFEFGPIPADFDPLSEGNKPK
jgi:hypothetical protein